MKLNSRNKFRVWKVVSCLQTEKQDILVGAAQGYGYDIGTWDSAVDIVTTLLASRSRVRIPAGGKHFSLLRNVQFGSGIHSASISISTGVLYRG